MQAVLDEYFCYQQFNELLNQEGHTSPTGDSSPENGEVRVRLISGKYYQMKYTGGAWVDVAIRLPSGYYLNQDGSASKGLSFDASGNATFEQNVDVKGSLKIGGVAGALIPLGGVFLGMFVNATLPAGWTRYTAMDDRVPRGSATPGTDGGSATHEHSFTIDIVRAAICRLFG